MQLLIDGVCIELLTMITGIFRPSFRIGR